jgi:acyl-coenzyme A thioesterase PaaI-like protein
MAAWDRFLKHAGFFRRALNIWPPLMGAGITVDHIKSDFREVTVLLKDRVVNRNYVGSHFGGSLFAMTDPFFMLMLIQNLGPKYYVWDKSSRIDFIDPAYGTIRADFIINEGHLSRIREATASGAKFEDIFNVDLRNESGKVVARVEKVLYFRLKSKYRPT